MSVPEKVQAGIDEIFLNHASGSRTFSVAFPDQDVRQIRERLKLSRMEFALQFGIPVRTLEKWEQNERRPEGPARAYLAVIDKNPEAVIAALRAQRAETVRRR
jgi:putative transcriptional regulator